MERNFWKCLKYRLVVSGLYTLPLKQILYTQLIKTNDISVYIFFDTLKDKSAVTHVGNISCYSIYSRHCRNLYTRALMIWLDLIHDTGFMISIHTDSQNMLEWRRIMIKKRLINNANNVIFFYIKLNKSNQLQNKKKMEYHKMCSSKI